MAANPKSNSKARLENDLISSASSLSGPFDGTLSGGSGPDILIAEPVRTHVASGAGADTLIGGIGDDWLVGGSGSDVLIGGAGNDRLLADSGNDTLTGGVGNDELDGGSGWDIARFSGSVIDYSFQVMGNNGAPGNAGLLTLVTDLHSTDGVDSVRKVEELQFSDRTIYLDGRNNIPVAVADQGAALEDRAYTLHADELTRNDWDFEGDKLSVTSVSDAINGTVTMDAQGNITFAPTSNHSGTASFRYTVSDSIGNLDTATVQLEITAVADAPALAVSLPDAIPTSGFAHGISTRVITEAESNNSLASANVIAREAFTVATNINLTDALDPSVTVAGIISSSTDRDYYQFSFKAGEKVIFDIDYGKPDVDTQIYLYDSTGMQLAWNDDRAIAHGMLLDTGSASWLDSYLAYQIPADGNYTMMVKPYRTGGDYQLNVSIDDTTAVGGAPTPIPLGINAALVDTDGSESLSIAVRGLPQGAILSAGTLDSDDTWNLSPDQLDALMLTLPSGAPEFSLVVDAVSVEASNGSTSHHVIGGNGADIISGGSEADVFTGGLGADIFNFDTLSRNADHITDFTTGSGGDVLDLRDLLQDAHTVGALLSSLVHTEDTATGTIVSVAPAGSETAFSTLVILEGVHGLSAGDLLAQGNIIF